MQAPEWRGDVPDLTLLNRIVVDALPLGLRADPVEPLFQRDIYFDSPDRALRRRGISCRFRIRMDDTRLLTLRIVGPPDVAASVIAPQTFEAVVPELDGAQAIAGTSDPARRLRAVIEPERLRPRIQFETERRLRRTLPQWWRRGRYEIVYDVVTVRSERRAQAFQELKIRELQRGRPGLPALSQAFVTQYGLRPLLVGKLDRAEKVLRDLEAARITAHEGREVALIVTDEHTVALFDDPRGLALPVAGGSGEQTCRELLRMHFGSADGNLRFLGTAPVGAARPRLEVWLAKRTALRDAQRRSSGHVRWLPVSEMLASAGAPGFRDPRTLAALAVLARSDAQVELPTPVAAPRPTAPAARPAFAAPTAQASEPVVPSLAEDALDRDFSALEFNARVLALAEDDRVPLLARVRFLSILSANLDEFFMVRVGALKRAVNTGEAKEAELLTAARLRVRALLERQSRCLNDVCLPALAAHGIRLVRWMDVPEAQREALRRHFHDQVFPLITPQAITRAPGHPFPLVPNLRLSLAVVVQDPRTAAMHFAYLRMPDGLPRFLPVSQEPAARAQAFVPIEEVIRENLGALYPGRDVLGAYAFRVTRAADLDLDEHHAASLLQVIDEETKRRPYGPPVRLEVDAVMPVPFRELVLRELQFEDAAPGTYLDIDDVYESTGLLNLGDLRELAQLPLDALDYPPHQPRHPIPANQSIFDVLSQRDLLLHHPYDDFATTVERLFIDAADDPDVVAIKVTLYRAGARSRIVDALLRAAASGKEVFVFVELKARFDEERNIEWVRKLEQESIRVVYGLVDFKTHAKTALIVRREAAGIRRYVHIGTGNYNAITSALYTDVGLLSSDPTLGADLHDLFNELSSSSQPPHTRFRAILVSPTYLLPRLLELIEREAHHARAGKGGRIRAKLNGLADPEVIQTLYAASQAGVDIDLIVRGICTLRPGVVGVSERIRVISILGRFLEHARIFHFANGGDPEYYIGSADWRSRNLRRRVEVVTPVRDAASRQRLAEILDAELRDPDAWELLPDGQYARSAARFATSTA